jgi:hypothetical protein
MLIVGFVALFRSSFSLRGYVRYDCHALSSGSNCAWDLVSVFGTQVPSSSSNHFKPARLVFYLSEASPTFREIHSNHRVDLIVDVKVLIRAES